MSYADVIVIGGGFAGLNAAAAFADAGAEVIVLEALEKPLSIFRGELLHPPGVSALDELGANDALSEIGAVAVQGFTVLSPGRRQEAILPYDARALLGAGFEHRALVSALRRRVAAHPRARFEVRARVEEITIERGRAVGVRCSAGGAHRARLLIVADGRHSRARSLLGIASKTSLLSYMAVAGLEGDVLPRPAYGHVFVGTPGPVLAYPYGDRRVRVCLDVPLEATKGGSSALSAYVRDHYTAQLPEPLSGALAAALREGRLTGCANHAMRVELCVVPGAALVGDAGGCSHPLTATGMTTALHDVATLLACVREHGLSDDALLSYQQRRHRYVRSRELFAQALYEIFRGSDLASQALREGVFGYWQRSARARRASLSVLTSEEPGLSAFLAEYVRVTGSSGWQLARSAVTRPRHVARALQALSATVAANAFAVCQHARSRRTLRRITALAPAYAEVRPREASARR